jgi:hypothetical protein
LDQHEESKNEADDDGNYSLHEQFPYLSPYLPLSTLVERGTGGEVFEISTLLAT